MNKCRPPPRGVEPGRRLRLEIHIKRLALIAATVMATLWIGGCSAGRVGTHIDPYTDAGCTFTPIAIPGSLTVVVHDNTAWGVPGSSAGPGSRIWRTDLATGAVAYSQDLREPVHQLGVAAGQVWACTRSWWALGPGMTLQVLDPTTLERRGSLPLKNRMLITRCAVFDCTDDPPSLIPIDASTHRPLAPIPLDRDFGPLGPICDGPAGEVYVLGTFSGILARVNLSTRRVEAQAHTGGRAVHPVSLEGILGGTGQGAYFGLTFSTGTVQVMSTRRGNEEIIVCDAASCQPLSRAPHVFEAGPGMIASDGWLWGTCHVRPTALSWAASKSMIIGRDTKGVLADRVIDPRLNGCLIEGDGRIWFFAGDQLCRMEFENPATAARLPE